METLFFGALNSIVEPAVRAGCGAPGVVPTGLVVLETTGRKSGRARRVPLLAAAFGDVIVVSTVRGGRSHWLANARQNGDVRYWLRGAPHEGRAHVITADDAMPRVEHPLARSLARKLGVAAVSGVSFAIITPTDAPRPRYTP